MFAWLGSGRGSGGGPDRAKGSLRDLSITWKLSAAILAVVAVLWGALALIAVDNIRTFRKGEIESTRLIARLVGEYSVHALAGRDPAEAARALARLHQVPYIERAALYDADGSLFATHEAKAGDPFPPRIASRDRDADSLMTGRSVDVFLDVAGDGRKYGTIQVRASTAALRAKIARYLAMVLMAGFSLALLATFFAMFLQRAIARPLLHLAAVAQRISANEDYSVRVKKGGGDEIGALSDAFDRMLSALEQRQQQRDLAQKAQRQYARWLRALHEIDQDILASKPLRTTAENALRQLSGLVEFERGNVVELEHDLLAARVLATHPPNQSPSAGFAAIGIRIEIPPAEGNPRAVQAEPVWRPGPAPPASMASDRTSAADRGSWRMIEDLEAAESIPRIMKSLGTKGLRAAISIPMWTENQLLGYLNVGFVEPGKIDPDAVEIATGIAELLAVAVSQARLALQIESHTEDLERRVLERTGQVEKTNRELEAFAYSVSHDLRAPLRAIRGFATAIVEDYGERLDDAGRDHLKRVMDASERMDALIHDLLEYSRLNIERYELFPISLAQVVQDSLAQLDAQLLERGAQVAVEGPLPSVLGHRPMLVQAITNLLTNALKFVAPGVEPRVSVRCGIEDGRARLLVEDNGIGIAPEHHERIFHVFERLHGRESFPGTGIGLAIVKRAAERMGGSVGVESELGRGSCFWLDLALA